MRYSTGCFPDIFDDRDRLYPMTRLADNVGVSRLPQQVDLSVHVDKVRDQGSTQSCVGHAITSALHIRAILTGKPVAHGSPLAAYTLGRSFDIGDPNVKLVDVGSRPRVVVQALKLFGVPSETDWPMSIDNVNTRPAFGQIRKGIAYRAGEYYWADDDENRVDTVKRALAGGFPVCCSLPADDSLFDPKDGVVDERRGATKGSHYVCLVGYDSSGFKILNSWSEEWGIRGYGILSESRLADPSTKSILAVGISDL